MATAVSLQVQRGSRVQVSALALDERRAAQLPAKPRRSLSGFCWFPGRFVALGSGGGNTPEIAPFGYSRWSERSFALCDWDGAVSEPQCAHVPYCDGDTPIPTLCR
jgi:hypothetical protein